MFNSRWLFLAALISTSGFAGVNFKQKQLRVQSLLKLKLHAPSLVVEDFQRELIYEKQGLTVEQRVKIETNLLAEKIRVQVKLAYEAALKENKSPEVARSEIKAAIEKDLALANSDMREDLLNHSINVLNNIENAQASEEVDLETVEVSIQKKVKSRKAFLNADFGDFENLLGADPITPTVNASKDSERKDYATKAELMESLVSDRESSRWVSTANQTIKTARVVRNEGKISIQIKVEFLGASIEAGPVIAFKREYSTNAVIMSEGLSPVLLKDGNFDLSKRDRNNEVILKNGKTQKRYVAFYCDADLKFSSEYTGAGGFKFEGLGADVSISKSFDNVVNMQSRRIVLPESVAGKTMTVKYISELCHGDFKQARFSNNMTVGESLDIMMKNMISGLIFSHPQTKCIQDSQCKDWFYSEVIAAHRTNNTYRCVEDSGDKHRFCQVRGQAEQSCIVYENGKQTSSGEWEYPCDVGLKCVKKQSASYLLDYKLTYSKGICQK